MTNNNHVTQARTLLAEAEAHDAALDRMYAAPGKPPSHLVASCHDKLRRSLKAAEVNALLAIADELSRIGLAR